MTYDEIEKGQIATFVVGLAASMFTLIFVIATICFAILPMIIFFLFSFFIWWGFIIMKRNINLSLKALNDL